MQVQYLGREHRRVLRPSDIEPLGITAETDLVWEGADKVLELSSADGQALVEALPKEFGPVVEPVVEEEPPEPPKTKRSRGDQVKGPDGESGDAETASGMPGESTG